MNAKKLNAGFSLVELLIALAVLAIIVIPIMTLLEGSAINIFSAGNKSKAVFDVQKDLESVMSDGSAAATTDPGKIVFPGVAQEVPVGQKVTVTKDYNRGDQTLSTELVIYIP